MGYLSIVKLNEHLSEKLNEMCSSFHEIDGNVGTALGVLHFQEVAHQWGSFSPISIFFSAILLPHKPIDIQIFVQHM